MLAMAVVLALLLAPASALAARHQRPPKPQLTWTLPTTASAGQPIGFTWTGSHLGKGHKLVVQKPEGTARTWRSIMRLNGNSGSAQLPGVELGHYRFRITDLAPVTRPHRRSRRHWRPHFQVMAEETLGIAVFGEVPFTTLFNSAEQAHATSSYSFAYVASYENGGSVFTVEHNHCSFVHIAFLGGGWWLKGETQTPTVTATLVQESREPTTVTAPENTIASLDAELVPGQSWALNLLAHSNEAAFYINGYAICDSAEPFS